jgi:dipeptidyl aminopeptidase/acylaminoacyl peptidase
MSSWVRGGQPGIAKLWIIVLDPKSGKVLSTEMLPLPNEIRSAQWAVWSPDGNEIAIEDNRGGKARSLWRIQIDGSRAQKLLDYEGSSINGADWTRDGKAIVYSALAGGRTQLFRIHAMVAYLINCHTILEI